ncbi:MAG: aspartate carbamoyltransferase [Bacillota bacterium]|jgi:aspartate carbamoyltransferase catalytic subunit|nr:aspartate carbamoyltransferase [Bacillota bacterium]HHU30203.1 aspartate carbamoyltransferase [Bacillota bacterium]
MYHILSCEQFSRAELEELFNLTDEIRNNLPAYRTALAGKLVATIFYEPSTRTRLSFEAAVQRLGGCIVSTENAKEMSSVIKGESLPDTIRVIAGYCDAIILRHPDVNSAREAAAVSAVPIINGGSGSGEHPTQALLDVYTIHKHKGAIDGLTVGIMGDLLFGRTVHSLVKLLALYENITVYGLSHDVLSLPEEYVSYLEKRGGRYIPCRSFWEMPQDIDVLYHTRTQTERFQNLQVEEFVVDRQVMSYFSPDTILLHPLPRRHEINAEVDADKRALYFQQSHNGMYVRMGLLYNILGKGAQK